MATLRHSEIAGVGHYVPSRVVKNAELEPVMDTSDAWIQERTGIQERRWFEEGTDTTAGMGAHAARKALEMAGLQPADVQLIVFATLSPDYFFPGSGVLLQRELGITNNCPALDVRNQCSGFVYGLSVADQFVRTCMYDTVLVWAPKSIPRASTNRRAAGACPSSSATGPGPSCCAPAPVKATAFSVRTCIRRANLLRS